MHPRPLSNGGTVPPRMSPLATYLVETSVTLVGIVGLAVLVIVFGRRLGVGRRSGALELVGKLPLDPRRAVYLVRVNQLVYVVAASEGGVVRLGSFDAAEFQDSTISTGPAGPAGAAGMAPTAVVGGFRGVLERLRSKPSGNRVGNSDLDREQP